MDNVKNDLQGSFNFRLGIEAEDKLTVALRLILVHYTDKNNLYSQNFKSYNHSLQSKAKLHKEN